MILSAARVGHPKSWFRTSLPRHHHAACSGGRAMKNADDPIPVGMISLRDACDVVCRAITPDWKILKSD
jgi:hypothetical protein